MTKDNDSTTKQKQAKPEVFIQDRNGTDAETEHGARYVISEISEDGDVKNLAFSDNEDNIKNKARDMGYELQETSNGYDCIKV